MVPPEAKEQTIAFGQAIGQALELRGWTQAKLGAEVARLLDEPGPIAQATVSNWIQGNNRPTPERAFAVEEAMDCAPGSLTKLLGFIPAHAVHVESVVAAIDADPCLSPMARRLLKASYQAAVGESAS